MVFTLDALHTNKKTARLITEDLHAHYVLTLKGNQPKALTAAHAALSGTNADWVHGSAVEDDRGHGRTERRSIRTTPADDTLFPGARQVFRIRRDVGDLDNVWTTKEIVYGITSLPDGLAGPEHLNWYQRPTLDRRKPAPLDPRYDLPGGLLTAQDRYRTSSPGRLKKLGDQHIPPRRTRANIAHARRDLHSHDDVFAVFGI
jgi:hypothetical protein